jgi:isoamylase
VGSDATTYVDNNGVAPNLNTANSVVRDLIIDSLSYWANGIGVDGFRFDLAPVLGNACISSCFRFDAKAADNALNRAIAELPLRPASGGRGVDLIAEPWGIGDGTYQLGFFPVGWAQWNDQFRETFRSAQNLLGVDNVVPAALSTRLAGSSDRFQKPWYSVNFLVAHDGFTLRDLYKFSYNGKNNTQPWDKGPSDGGSDSNRSWDQGGSADLQRQAARTGYALLMLSAGVPMMTGGDEMYRTQFGNNNMYNVDSPSNWLNYDNAAQQPHFVNYSRKLLAFRGAHPGLRPAEFFKGTDNNGNGLKDLTWLNSDGKDIVAEQPGYFGDASQHFLGYRIDGSEFGDSAQSICVLYNGWKEPVTATLPPNLAGKKWYGVADTAGWMENIDNFNAAGTEELLTGATYSLAGRSVLLLMEK